MSNFVTEPPKVPIKEPQKCNRCPNYFRKVEEITQNLSGKEKVIEVLQSQHKALQQKYKKILDDYESLRLERIQIVQDNLYLKENEKLQICCKCNNQHQAIQKQSASAIRTRGTSCKGQSFSTKMRSNEDHINHVQINEASNELFKDITNKILNELKKCNCLNAQDLKNISHELNGKRERSTIETTETFSTTVIKYCRDDSRSTPCLQKGLQETSSCSFCRPISAPSIIPSNTKNTPSTTQDFKCGARSSSGFQKTSRSSFDRDVSAGCMPSFNRKTSRKTPSMTSTGCTPSFNKKRSRKTPSTTSAGCMPTFNRNTIRKTSSTTQDFESEPRSTSNKSIQFKEQCAPLQEKDVQTSPSIKGLYDQTSQCQGPCNNFQNRDSQATPSIAERAEKHAQLASELIRKEIEFTQCKCQFSQEIFELTENNKMLSETLANVTAENKANIQQIYELSEYLENITEQYEQYVCGTKCFTDKLKNELERRESDLKSIRKSSVDEQSQIAQLKQEATNLKKELAEYKKSDEIQCNKVFVANEKALNLTQAKQNLETENDNLRNEIAILKEENIGLTFKCNEFESESLKNKTQIDHLNDIVQNQQTKIKSLLKENSDFKYQLDECRIKLREIQDKCKCDEFKEEIDILEADVSKKQAIILELEKTVTNFNSVMAQCEQNVEELSQENRDLHNNNSRLLQQISDLNTLVARYKDECAQKCAEFDNIQKSLEDSKSEKLRIEQEVANLKIKTSENENLQQKLDQTNNQCSCLFDTVERLEAVLADLQASYNQKNVELDTLKSTYSSLLSEYNTVKIKNKDFEKELNNLRKAHQELERAYDAKTSELNRLKKQYESCSQQSQITREEYCNLRKEYKEIKNMLAEQIHKYKLNTDDVQEIPGGSMVVASLKQKLLQKEQEITALQQKNKDLCCEILEIKDYMHKLISDNNILKSAINNLIDNLESKIKGSNIDIKTSGISTEIIASEILQSLTYMEHDVVQKTQDCPIKECICKTGTSQPTQDNTKIRLSSPGYLKESSTDSDEPQFFDKKSLEVLKQALSELKESKQSIIRDSCTCEESAE